MRPFAVGDRVSQQQYGEGTVMAADEHHTVVDFDEHGTRKFATRLVRLERSSSTAPVRPAKPARKPRATKKAVG